MDDLGDSLSTLRQYVGAAAQQAGLETQAVHRLRLAVDEVAANIIMYGYADSQQPGVVEVTVTVDDDKLTLVLEDTGKPYNPLEREMPDNLEDPLDTREMGGLGIYLAIRNVDGFDYQRAGDRNRNVFVMKRRSG
jgi:anti-sigma regulatory factor (Ser/Thr protein kinase)